MDELGPPIAVFAAVTMVIGVLPGGAAMAADPSGDDADDPQRLLPWSQQARLPAPAEDANQRGFGRSLAVEGDTALVGHFKTAESYVLTDTAEGWTHTAALEAELDGDTAPLGVSLALDGDTILVGSWSAAAAFVFEPSAEGWTQTASLTPDDDAHAAFGNAVSLDGDTAIVGAYRDEAAYVFEETAEGWEETARLDPTDAGDRTLFGYDLTLEDGTALVGAPSEEPGGAAYAFEETETGWRQTERFTALDTERGDLFGVSLDLDDGRALVGASRAELEGHGNEGVAYLFEGTSDGFTQVAEIVPRNPTPGSWFGFSVDLDGSTAVVGAHYANRNLFTASSAGAAYVFQGAAGTWQETAKLTSSTADTHDDFGMSVAVDEDRRSTASSTVLVGAPEEQAGFAYVYEETPASDAVHDGVRTPGGRG